MTTATGKKHRITLIGLPAGNDPVDPPVEMTSQEAVEWALRRLRVGAATNGGHVSGGAGFVRSTDNTLTSPLVEIVTRGEPGEDASVEVYYSAANVIGRPNPGAGARRNGNFADLTDPRWWRLDATGRTLQSAIDDGTVDLALSNIPADEDCFHD